jgi:hypothetical protein
VENNNDQGITTLFYLLNNRQFMEKSKILYAEDDTTIAFLVQDSLESYYDISGIRTENLH